MADSPHITVMIMDPASQQHKSVVLQYTVSW